MGDPFLLCQLSLANVPVVSISSPSDLGKKKVAVPLLLDSGKRAGHPPLARRSSILNAGRFCVTSISNPRSLPSQGRPLDYLSMSLREFGEMLFARIVFAARFISLGRSRFPS
jgi:hypothetical protein